jgi:hypothetical protein
LCSIPQHRIYIHRNRVVALEEGSLAFAAPGGEDVFAALRLDVSASFETKPIALFGREQFNSFIII